MLRGQRVFTAEEAAEMSARLSPSTGRPYGVARTCAAWGIPRSSFYARTCPSPSSSLGDPAPERRKPGPKPEVSDSELLSLIREDLASSPFSGEGHRKVWARLRCKKGIPVAQKRVLRLMREANLLSPHRMPQRPPYEHTGRIVTSEPNVMWGTDGAKVFTLKDGWGWIFACLEHWNAEVMGWHVTKRGDRFAALEPVAQGIMSEFGSVEAGSARGLSLRIDHGSQYLSDHFQKQIKAWGIAPSFAFLEQPQTNGVAERFFRTLKEQVIYGRVYENLEEVRQAVSEFVELYNNQWLIEKNGYLSPVDARRAYYGSEAA
jgi:transposase InsO family protein